MRLGEFCNASSGEQIEKQFVITSRNFPCASKISFETERNCMKIERPSHEEQFVISGIAYSEESNGRHVMIRISKWPLMDCCEFSNWRATAHEIMTLEGTEDSIYLYCLEVAGKRPLFKARVMDNQVETPILYSVHPYMTCDLNWICNKNPSLQPPGLEPGPSAWEAEILPLDYDCLHILRMLI